MNKKFLGLFAALVVLGSTGAFASAAIGLQGGYNPDPYRGAYNNGAAALTFKLSSLPCVFALDASIGGGQLYSLGLTADWWIANPKLSGIFHYYYGTGLAGGVTFGGNAISGAYVGGRFLAGVNVFVVKQFELYLQAAIQPTYYFNDGFYLPIPVNFGFRFWF